MLPTYLDYNATSPLDPRVFEVMKDWFLGPPANAGSRTHVYGQRAKDAVENARKQVANVIDAKPGEIYFTSGATESNNIAVLGLSAYGERTGRKHIISTAIEHKAILEPLEEMKKRGFDVELAPVTTGGFVEPETIKRLLRKDTLLVSVMHANNETGILQPLKQISEIVAETETLFHTDAAQTFGKELDELKEASCDLISISSHKVFGPQGIGALYIRRVAGKKRNIEPIFFGGGQERGLRSGTVPVPLVVGLGKAASLATTEHLARAQGALEIREFILKSLGAVGFQVNGAVERCQPHVINIRFPGIDSEALMIAMNDKLAVSNGSACTTSSYKPSHVLLAMGLEEDEAGESVRISWGSELHNKQQIAEAFTEIEFNF